MEDLTISPWQNQEPLTLTNFYNSKQKQSSKLNQCPTAKNRFIHTQSNAQPQPFQKNNTFQSSVVRKKGQSSSTHQSFYQAHTSGKLSKLQIKLVPYPIQQKSKQRQPCGRFSQKIQGKQTHSNQSFEAIQTIFNSELKKTNFLKKRSPEKHNTVNHKPIKSKFQKTTLKNIHESLSKLKNNKPSSYQIQNYKNAQIRYFKENEFKCLMQMNQNNQTKINLIRKKSVSRKRFQNHYHSQIQELPQLNKTYDERQMIRIQQNNKNELQVKPFHKQRKLSVDKLENINCFKDTTNIFTNLKKKNKRLFNQLEKYNLFGLRNLRRKNQRK